jgi:hypothetical protein
MKIYKGTYSNGRRLVTVDGSPLAARDSGEVFPHIDFAWGEDSEGAERLAISILADCLDEDEAAAFAPMFATRIVARLKPAWEFTSKDAEDVCNHEAGIGGAVQNAVLERTAFAQPARPIRVPTSLPRLLENPNYRLDENAAT